MVDTQVIANLVTINDKGQVLLTQLDDSEKWWLPGEDVEPFTHPDDTVAKIAAKLTGEALKPNFDHLESFRGRRGWHLMFNYVLLAGAARNEDGDWHDVDALPKTAHGNWEKQVIRQIHEKHSS